MFWEKVRLAWREMPVACIPILPSPLPTSAYLLPPDVCFCLILPVPVTVGRNCTLHVVPVSTKFQRYSEQAFLYLVCY